MDRTERFYHIDRLLHELQVVPLQTFLDELEVSLATFKRDLEYLRERFNAPIVWDHDAGGYRFDKVQTGPRCELPQLWFNASEVYALLTMQQLLKKLKPGLLAPHVERLLAFLHTLDAVRAVRLTAEPALECDDEPIQRALDAGSGIFSGKTVEWAELEFTVGRTRWMSLEGWHSQQQGCHSARPLNSLWTSCGRFRM